MPWRLRCGPEDQMFNNAIYHGKKRYNKTACPTTKALQVLPGGCDDCTVLCVHNPPYNRLPAQLHGHT